MASARLERICPYCGSNRLTFLEHGSQGTLFQCDMCARAAVQRWAPDAEEISRTPGDDAPVRPPSAAPRSPGQRK